MGQMYSKPITNAQRRALEERKKARESTNKKSSKTKKG